MARFRPQIRLDDAAVASAGVTLTLGQPVPDRLCRRFELTRQLLRRAAGAYQVNHLAAQRLPTARPQLRKAAGPYKRGILYGSRHQGRTAGVRSASRLSPGREA